MPVVYWNMWRGQINILHVLVGKNIEYVLEYSYTLMCSDGANIGELGNANKFAMVKKKDALTDIQGWYSARIEIKK